MPKLRFLILATPVLAGGLLTACGDSTGPGSVVGIYILQTFNGLNLPVQLGPPGPPGTAFTRGEITAGSVQLLDMGNTCSVSLTIRTTVTDATGNVTSVTTDTETGTCTYSVTGTTIQLDFPGEAPVTGTISGNTITVFDDLGGGPTSEGTFVFRK